MIKLALLFGGAIASIFLLAQNVQPVQAYYGDGCESYGYSAYYDSLSGGCKCTYGYVFGKDYLGNTSCVSGTSVCTDKYGYNSTYDSLSNSCECSYGYTFGRDSIGRTQCVSLDSICKDQLGYSSRYNSLSDKCECSYGYIIDGGRCTDGDSVCRTKHGLYSSYDSLSSSCECDDGYTLDNNSQCVEKQNNVYFRLKELDTDNKLAIIKSNYDYRYYLISYGTGCYNFSFRRYLNDDIVLNLGTDFDVDRWDKIVLQDDDEICDIRSVERADSSTTLEPEEEEEDYSYVDPIYTTTYISPAPTTKVEEINKDFGVSVFEITSYQAKGTVASTATFRKCPSTQCSVIRYFSEDSKLNIMGKYKDESWYQVQATTDAGGIGNPVIGWVHGSTLKSIVEDQKVAVNTDKEIEVEETEKIGFFTSIWKGLLGWFR